ncbi:hypothetical protein SAMN05216588_107254 [Pseudomonas flavescens]|uniref:Lipoprotein n=1 Tax=Phytopseudomonas flavescens TaxID=29435 RepID=A0A1G8FFC1_9GAMM|nr:DUF6491 family protein [Pseudomonas flavescens]SDH80719.1 hypothetical protein SAMN05216588_107254 [Pseudomonas flavescens]
MSRIGCGAVMLLTLLLGACAQSPARDESLPLEQRLAGLGYRQGEGVDAVQRVAIDGWQYLDKTHIILGDGPGRSYLITFSRPCRNLNFSNSLGFSTTVGSLTRLDRIVSSDGSGFAEHCLIGELHRLEKLPKPGK